MIPLLLAASLLAAAPSADAPLVPYELKDEVDTARALREFYTRHEYRVPMRDGVTLYTIAHVPKDATRTWPILLVRTPYSVQTYGVDNQPAPKSPRELARYVPSPLYVRDGYILVQQDVRGRMMSEGTFVDLRPGAAAGGVDEATDAWDTIDWLVKHVPRNNGRVGTWGISWPGRYAAESAIDAHPALKAVSPQAPVTDWYLGDDFHHRGVLFLADAFGFYGSFGKPRPAPTRKSSWSTDRDTGDAYDFFLRLGPLANVEARYFKGGIPFWTQLSEHPDRDAFWKDRDPRSRYRDATPAVLTVGGWYDAEDLWGALATYQAFEAQHPRGSNTLVMGPWKHGGWARTDGDRVGDCGFGQKTAPFYREHIEFPFFQQHLKGRAAGEPVEAWAFETGTNEWQRYAQWPPKASRTVTLNFGPGGTLTPTPPTASEADTFISDPAKPVPYRARASTDIDNDFMCEDQRFASRRPDVLAYQSPPLDEDVLVAGPVEASIWLASTGRDADVVVKLVDVFPDEAADPEPNPSGVKLGGAQVLVRAEVMRARYRQSFEKPVLLTPGEPAQIRFPLPDVNHVFRVGHRVMVQVQSSWFPLAERNPQSGVDPWKATEADFVKATHTVWRAPGMASGVALPIARGTLRAALPLQSTEK